MASQISLTDNETIRACSVPTSRSPASRNGYTKHGSREQSLLCSVGSFARYTFKCWPQRQHHTQGLMSICAEIRFAWRASCLRFWQCVQNAGGQSLEHVLRKHKESTNWWRHIWRHGGVSRNYAGVVLPSEGFDHDFQERRTLLVYPLTRGIERICKARSGDFTKHHVVQPFEWYALTSQT